MSAVILVAAAAGSDDRELRGAIIDLLDFITAQIDLRGRDVLADSFESPAAWNGDDAGRLRQQPGERDLPRGCSLAVRYLLHQGDDGLVGLEGFASKARESAADVVVGERLAAADRAGEKP